MYAPAVKCRISEISVLFTVCSYITQCTGNIPNVFVDNYEHWDFTREGSFFTLIVSIFSVHIAVIDIPTF